MLRNGISFGSPTRWAHGLASFQGESFVASWKLRPGVASAGEQCVVGVQHRGHLDANWVAVAVSLMVAGAQWPVMEPTALYIRDPRRMLVGYSGPTGIVHFPALGGAWPLDGQFTVLLKALVVPRLGK